MVKRASSTHPFLVEAARTLPRCWDFSSPLFYMVNRDVITSTVFRPRSTPMKIINVRAIGLPGFETENVERRQNWRESIGWTVIFPIAMEWDASKTEKLTKNWLVQKITPKFRVVSPLWEATQAWSQHLMIQRETIYSVNQIDKITWKQYSRHRLKVRTTKSNLY